MRKGKKSKASRRRVALRNLAKARKVRRSNKRAGRKHHVKGYSYKRRGKTVRVRGHRSYETPRRRRRRHSARAAAAETPRRRRRRSRASAAEAPRRRRRRSHARAAEAPRRRRRRSSAKRRRRSHARAAEAPRRRRRRGHRKHHVRGHMKRVRGGRKVRVRSHMSHETSHRHHRRRRYHRRAREAYALENPLSGTELAVGAFTGLLGYAAADALDRVLATHALVYVDANHNTVTTPVNGTDGNPLYGDTPPAASAGSSYTGLYNATAILAPMDWKRWAAGVAITGLPFIATIWVKAPVGRSALQFFGFGAGVRVLGKALNDLLAMLTGRTSWGARMYDGEARAAALKAVSGNLNDTSLALFPSTGLGAPAMQRAGLGACGTCQNCRAGVGSCCRSAVAGSALPPAPQQVQPPSQQYAPPPQYAAPPPSMMAPPPPTYVAPPQQRQPAGSPIPTNLTMAQQPQASPPRMLAGVPTHRLGGSGSPRVSRYSWGDEVAA